MHTLRLSTSKSGEMVNITSQIQNLITQSGVKRGLCLVMAPHTTAGIAIQEGFDPDVVRDTLSTLERLAPREGDYRHAEGNSDAHIKALMTGSGQTLPVEYGKLQLGRWQAVFFCEYDGPRERTVWVQIVASNE